jgi:hypothetical protein
MGFVNVIWQGDANRIAIECLPHAASPAFVLNLTGAERLSVRKLAEWFGQRFQVRPQITGEERADSLLSNTDQMQSLFAPPRTGINDMLDRVADWVEHGGALLGKPTKFETRDGKF